MGGRIKNKYKKIYLGLRREKDRHCKTRECRTYTGEMTDLFERIYKFKKNK